MGMRRAWSRAFRRRYGSRMGLARHPRVPPEAPIRRPQDLDQFVGEWVAIKDGQVIARAASSRQLVYEVRRLGNRGRGAVAQYVAPPGDSHMVGVG